jgi:lysophospholipase L1-like esterase
MSNSEGARTAGDASAASKAPSTPLKYVALGDSYVAAPLVPVTDVANGCFRSSNNYPSIVAKKLGARLDDRSCGGARTIDFRRSQFPDVPPQLTAIKPGVDLVTIGIGGNDESVFGQLVDRCPQLKARDPQGAPCQQFMGSSGKDTLLTALDRTGTKVTALVREVRERLPKAQVLVVGYPQIVAPGNVCPQLPLARGDYAYAEKVNLALTEMLRTAAKATGATYVDVWSASSGHDICSADPWINGSVNNDKAAARYHPFAKEQAAVADLIVKAVQASS